VREIIYIFYIISCVVRERRARKKIRMVRGDKKKVKRLK
jgi:hypothetical protein